MTSAYSRSTVSKVHPSDGNKGTDPPRSRPQRCTTEKLVLTPDGKKLQAAIERECRETERLLRQDVTEEELKVFISGHGEIQKKYSIIH